MPRPDGVFTYDAQLRRFRNPAGQLIPTQVIIPDTPARSVSADDALEMQHTYTEQVSEQGVVKEVLRSHVAGASTPEWLREMVGGLRQPCETCGQSVGLGDVTLTSTHSRDWSKHR